jgi:hypothetical protein
MESPLNRKPDAYCKITAYYTCCLQMGSILINLGTVRHKAAKQQYRPVVLQQQLHGSNDLQDKACMAPHLLAGTMNAFYWLQQLNT